MRISVQNSNVHSRLFSLHLITRKAVISTTLITLLPLKAVIIIYNHNRIAIRREILVTASSMTIYSGGCRHDKPAVCCSRRLVGSCVEVNPSLTATAELYRPDADHGVQQSRAPRILCVWVREGRTWNYEITGFDA